MKFVSWNCNGAFRKKFHLLDDMAADVYVIQECEDPARSNDTRYIAWASNYLWLGQSKNKGVGVFAKPEITLEHIAQDVTPLEYFLPCKVAGEWTLLAVWTREANSPTFKYIGQLYKYLQLHGASLDTPRTVIAGDLNSNACWDVWDRWWNHSDVVNSLADMGIVSLYHQLYGQLQGAELTPTFYMQRKLEKPYHIDYAFASAGLIDGAALAVGSPEAWLEHSDHMPLLFSLDKGAR